MTQVRKTCYSLKPTKPPNPLYDYSLQIISYLNFEIFTKFPNIDIFDISQSNPDWTKFSSIDGFASKSTNLDSAHLLQQSWSFDGLLTIRKGQEGKDRWQDFRIKDWSEKMLHILRLLLQKLWYISRMPGRKIRNCKNRITQKLTFEIFLLNQSWTEIRLVYYCPEQRQ